MNRYLKRMATRKARRRRRSKGVNKYGRKIGRIRRHQEWLKSI